MARFCAYININQPMKIKICLKNKNGEHIQDIIFDIPPMICKVCNKYGHTDTDYPTKAKHVNNQVNGYYRGNKNHPTMWRPLGGKNQNFQIG